MPDSWNRILGFLDFAQPDMTELEILQNAANYSAVMGGLSDLNPVFRTANPDITIAWYTTGLFDNYNARPDPYTNREDDTPERRARTLLWWNTEADGVGHPDWVLYSCDRVTPAYWVFDDGSTLPNMPLDFSNPDVADWEVRTSEAEGFDAFFADLVYLGNYSHACGIYRDGEWVQLYTGEPVDPAFTAAVLAWAGRMGSLLHSRPAPLGFIPNVPLYPSYRDEDILAFLANLDGLLDEEGFTGYGNSRLVVAGDVWLNKIRNMIRVQDAGVAYFSMNYVDEIPPSQDEAQWVLGSFLMGKEHSAYILMTFSPIWGNYGPHWPHLPQYDEDIGHPCAPMTSTQHLYVRDYSKGLAVANPDPDKTYRFDLPAGEFQDIYGNPVDSVLILEPLTARVLLSSEDRCL
jgi:hypothetical protein